MKSLFDQVTDTMLVTTFVFLGVEGASVYSRFARRREDVGRATLLGFLSVLAIFASVTMVSYGVLPRAELANTHPPSMAAVLQSVVGPWGGTFISVGVIISVQGAYLAWTLINAEVLYIPATTGVMPKFLARNNKNHTPIAALITTNVAVQALLVTVLFVHDALDFMLALDTALSLIPISSLRDTPSSSPSPETYAAADESSAGDSRSSPPWLCCIRCSCCTPRGSNISWWRASFMPQVPCSTSGPAGSRACLPAGGGRICIALVVAAIVGIVLISTGYLAL